MIIDKVNIDSKQLAISDFQNLNVVRNRNVIDLVLLSSKVSVLLEASGSTFLVSPDPSTRDCDDACRVHVDFADIGSLESENEAFSKGSEAISAANQKRARLMSNRIREPRVDKYQYVPKFHD